MLTMVAVIVMAAIVVVVVLLVVVVIVTVIVVVMVAVVLAPAARGDLLSLYMYVLYVCDRDVVGTSGGMLALLSLDRYLSTLTSMVHSLASYHHVVDGGGEGGRLLVLALRHLAVVQGHQTVSEHLNHSVSILVMTVIAYN